MRIIVAEYPKSGGSWFVNLLGDMLTLPKRDIYVADGFNLFDLSKHPWYENASSFNLTDACVIKSHELPDSALHNFPAQYIHLIRDGRDVVVSKYFYEKDFCVKNAIYESFDIPFDEYVEKTAFEWKKFVIAWLDTDAMVVTYEALRRSTYSVLQDVLKTMEQTVSPEQIVEAVQRNSIDKMRSAWGRTFKHNTFVRKAVVGDWRTHFTDRHKEVFKQICGELLIKLNYEKDCSW